MGIFVQNTPLVFIVKRKSMLEVHDLTKIYGSKGKEVRAVDGVSFDVKEGDVVGLLGPNGAGKTTTIKCMCDLIMPTSGTIAIDGVNCLENPGMVHKSVSAVLEGNRNIYWRLSVEDNLRFFAGLMGREDKKMAEELMETFELSEKRKTQARFLSRGMQQKLAIACALIRDTPVVLLDEPTLGLDVTSSYSLRERMKMMTKEYDKTLLLSSHDMHVVEDVCKRVIIINHGRKIIDSTVDGLKTLFRTRSYGIVIKNGLKIDARKKIEEVFNARINVSDNKTEIEAQLRTSEMFFELVEYLKAEGCRIDTVREKEPDLEEIFIKTVGEKNDATLDPF